MQGTYTAEGIIKIAEALKVNKTLTSIKYAPPSGRALAYLAAVSSR